MTKRKPFPHSTDIERLMACIGEGLCCSVVGLSNMGKSTVLRAVCTPAVRQRFPAQNGSSRKPGGADSQKATPRGRADSAFFYVDCNLMLTMSEQGFYEATLRAVQSELVNISASSALVERIEALYKKVVEPPSAFVGPLSFNEGVIALCEQLERRVVFVFDEFDAPFAQLDGRVFLNLRALRDKYGSRLCFITATEKRLTDGRDDSEATEFGELFASCTQFIKMLPPDEARLLVADVAEHNAVTLDQDEEDFIMAQAGGHPGLLVAVASVLLRVSSSTPAGVGTPSNLTLVRQLLDSDAAVRGECVQLWGQFTEVDQAALSHLLTASEASPPNEHARQHLIEAGVLTDAPALALFSPLFEAFVRRQFRAQLPAHSGVYVDVDSGEVWVDGRKLPTLTDLEYRLLLLLYGRLDKICDKYQVVEAVWGQDFIDDVDDARVEKLISRLRQKLEEDPANPRYFQTVRGRGYRLISG